MKHITYKILVAFFAVSLLSCSKSENEPVATGTPDARVFYAQVPKSGDNSRTIIDGDWNIYWYAGDNLSVFQSATNEQYRFAGTSGEIINEFHKCDSSVPGTAYPRNYAIYPYSDTAECSSDGVITASLPSLQQYSPDTFGQDANTMVAATQNSADDVFYFQNVCGYLRLKIYGGDTIRKIVLRGNNGEKIAGNATITASCDSAPSVVMGESATTEITLDCGEKGIETVDDPNQFTSFWMVVPPVTFSKGFTIDITTLNGITRSQVTEKSITITQNMVKQMAAFDWGTQTSPKITSFGISDGVHTYKAFDISHGYVNIMVPNQSDLSNMTAKFTYRGISVKVDGVEQISGKNNHNFNDFANPVEYVVSASDETTHAYKIRIFDLPILAIEIPNREEITSNKKWLDWATVKYRDTNNFEYNLGIASIKGRGNSTWRYPKKPYNLKFVSKQSFWGLPEHKRWCLLANWMDKTLLRNAVSFEIARKCDGLAWTPNGDYVEVILNGRHIGNYYLCEQIKVDKGRVNISEENGNLMLMDSYYDEVYKFKSTIRNLPYEFKDPDEVDETQFNFIQSYVNDMESSLYDDTKFASRDYLNYLDVNSAIDYWFVYELAMNYEPNAPKSVYSYKDGSGVMYFGPVWDFDYGTYLLSCTESWRIKNGALYYTRLFQDKDFINEVYCRWINIKSRFDNIPMYLDAKSAQIKSSESRDRILWPFTDTVNGEVSLTFDQAVARMRKAYMDKLSWMDIQIKAMPTFNSGTGKNENYEGKIDSTDEFNFNF